MNSVRYENLFDVNDLDVIVLPVNVEGVLGAGMAKEFRKRYPLAANVYYQMCSDEDSSLSQYGYGYTKLDENRHVLFFATKLTWRENSSKHQLDKVFNALHSREPDLLGGLLVGAPPLGCGCGKLNREYVIPYIRRRFINLGAFVRVYDLPFLGRFDS